MGVEGQFFSRLERAAQWRGWSKSALWLLASAFLLGAGLAQAQETVCARVKIEIKQQLTLERQAFDAEMKIANTLDNVTGEVQRFYHHNDHLGTPQKSTDVQGNIVWSQKSTAFGETQVESTSVIDNPHRFPGQYYDPETNTHYNYFRNYDQHGGRYTQTDPIGLAGGINTYAYVRGSPLKRGDPLGLFEDGKRYYANENKIPLDQVPATIPYGHSDMYGGNIFDFTKEDHSWWSRPENIFATGRHFRPMSDVIPEIEEAISLCNQDEFERKMHQFHDHFSHYAKGYRWGSEDPNTPCNGVGHLCDIKRDKSNPDYDEDAWAEANRAQRSYVDRFAKKCGVCGELQ